MSITYKKGEIVWAKIQGYSWWPARITQIKLNLNIKKSRLGKLSLQYDKEPYFYLTFFPNDSTCKVRNKNLKKFIDKYKQRAGETKKKKLQKAIDIATKAYLKENPDINLETKQKIFNIKLFAKNKFNKLKEYLSIIEDEEEQNGENDIQSFIDSEANEIENYKKELKNKKNKDLSCLGKKRKSTFDEDTFNKKNKSGNLATSDDEEYEDSYYSKNSDEIKNDINKKFNKELKKNSDELFRINIEIKRKNNINNIINILENIENIINKNIFEYDFNITKDLLIILNSYTHYNNETIMNKSLSLHKEIVDKYLNGLFSYDNIINESSLNSSQELNDFLNNHISICEEILNNIYNLNTEKNKNSSSSKKKNIINEQSHSDDLKDLDIIALKKDLDNTENKNTDNIANNISNNSDEEEKNNYSESKLKENKENKENEIGEENKDKIQFNNNEPFLRDLLNTPNYFSKKIKGQLYPDNFFKDIYLKSNINSRTELLRKKMCLQLYNILKLVLPFCEEDTFKKNIIFLEYLARKNDPSFGNKYMTIINMIYNKIKVEAVKLKNKNKK